MHAFNRTIIELKHPEQLRTRLDDYTSFNRTIIELKQDERGLALHHVHAFNRTIIELKLYQYTPI